MARKSAERTVRKETTAAELRDYAAELQSLAEILRQAADTMDREGLESSLLFTGRITGFYGGSIAECVHQIRADIDVDASAKRRQRMTRVAYRNAPKRK